MNHPLRFLSLYSGIGSHDFGFRTAGISIVGQIEIDDFCRAVLEKQFGHLPRWSDVKDATVESIRAACGVIDGITGGFSCQDISTAGKGAGLGKKTRSGVTWREMFRIIRGLRPHWLVIENVPALRSRGYDRVAAPLERIGYTLWPSVAGAWTVGAPHKRDRVWIVGRLENSARNVQRNEGSAQRPNGERVGPAGDFALDNAIRGGRQQDERGRGENDSQRTKYAIGATASESNPLADAPRIGERESANQCHAIAIGRDSRDEFGNGGIALADPELFGRGRREGREVGSVDNGPDAGRIESNDQSSGVDPDELGLAGVGQADTGKSGLESGRTLPGGTSPQFPVPSGGGLCSRWPSRPGQSQHEWEAPRLIKFGVGRELARTAGGLVRATRKNARAIVAGSEVETGEVDWLKSYQNKQALKAFGNCNPPNIPYLIGRWIMSQAGGAA